MYVRVSSVRVCTRVHASRVSALMCTYVIAHERARCECVCACVCVCVYDYHIAVSIKTLAPFE